MNSSRVFSREEGSAFAVRHRPYFRVKGELLKLYPNSSGVGCYFLLVPKCARRVPYFSVF